MPRKPKSGDGGGGGRKGKRAPAASVDEVFAEIVRRTDAFCRAHLNAEYAELSRMLAENLYNEPDAPLLKGTPEGWAAGVVFTVGWVNFLSDPSQTPHLKTADFCRLVGVSQATVMARSKVIRTLYDLIPMDPRLTLPSRLDDNMLVWLIELENGMIDDARRYPRSVQERLVAAGMIPHVHRDAVDDTGDDDDDDESRDEQQDDANSGGQNGGGNGYPG
jgi:hypothetical protein